MTSPTSDTRTTATATGRRRLRLAGSVLVVLALLGTTVSTAAADNRDDRRKVRHEIARTRDDVADSRQNVDDAEQQLEASRTALETARSRLAEARQKLATAKAEDDAIADRLAAAELALDQAAAAVTRGEADVAAQEGVIGQAVRSTYQQQNDLVTVSLLLESESPENLANRLQWTDLIFDSTSAQLARLEELQARLETARQRRAEAEANLAKEKRASAEQVAIVKSLAADATAREQEVAELVAANEAALADAESALESDQDAYDALQAEEARITAKIKAEILKEGSSGKRTGSWGFVKPVNAPAGSGFGMRFHPILHYWRMHWGTDFGAACGQPIFAMADGRVISAGWTTTGLGYYTIIGYGSRKGVHLASGYAHQSKIIVHAGEKVKQGEVVGYVGTTGLSTGCHLHLQIYRDGVRVNPINYL